MPTADDVAKPDDVAVRRAAVASAAEAVRGAIRALVLTDSDVNEIQRAERLAREISEQLSSACREPTEPSPFDLPGPDGRMFGVVRGPGNPMAPPMRLTWYGDHVEGRCTLGPGYEGPRGYVHGGISALLLDEVMAKAPEMIGMARVTGTLEVCYLRPVPLAMPLLLTARLTAAAGRRIMVRGKITVANRPGTVLVRGEGLFVRLDGAAPTGPAVPDAR